MRKNTKNTTLFHFYFWLVSLGDTDSVIQDILVGKDYHLVAIKRKMCGYK